MNRYNVKNCPAYEYGFIECNCNNMPSVNCYQVTAKHCPIKKMIDSFIEKKTLTSQDILEIFEVVEIEE